MSIDSKDLQFLKKAVTIQDVIELIQQITTGALINQGSWNALTNTPALIDGVGTSGYYYTVSVAGSQDLGSGNIAFEVGDEVRYSGSVWYKFSNTDAVSSVNNQTGVVVLAKSDIGLSNVDNTSDINKTISTSTQNALDTKLESVNLTSDVNNILPIANGGTNSSTALTNGKVMVSSGGKMIEATNLIHTATQNAFKISGVGEQRLIFEQTNNGVDAKRWYMAVSGNSFVLGIQSDNGITNSPQMTAVRNGLDVTEWGFNDIIRSSKGFTTEIAKNAKSIVHFQSTTQGALLPVMTQTQRQAITTPPIGLEVYDSTNKTKAYFDGTVWDYNKPPIVQVTALTKSLGLTDANTEQEMSNAASQTLTIEPDATTNLPIGTRINVINYGVGVVTIAEGAGVTIIRANSLVMNGQGSSVELVKRAADTWSAVGGLV